MWVDLNCVGIVVLKITFQFKNQNTALITIWLYFVHRSVRFFVCLEPFNFYVFANHCSDDHVRKFCSWCLLKLLSIWPLAYICIFYSDIFILKDVNRQPFSFKKYWCWITLKDNFFKNVLDRICKLCLVSLFSQTKFT